MDNDHQQLSPEPLECQLNSHFDSHVLNESITKVNGVLNNDMHFVNNNCDLINGNDDAETHTNEANETVKSFDGNESSSEDGELSNDYDTDYDDDDDTEDNDEVNGDNNLDDVYYNDDGIKQESNDSNAPINNDDIDIMLEAGLCNYQKSRKRTYDEMKMHVNPPHEERKKIVLKRRDQDYFEVLPEGWIEVTHFSGMPVYLNKQYRVCTVSKPYYLGPGSARKHEIPISAIPCLQYKRELEKEEKIKESKANESEESSMNLPVMAKVESVKENKKEKSLDFMAVRNYCEKLFEFQTLTIRKFKTWADRRKHTQMRKSQQRPSLPEGTKLITCPLPKTSYNSGPSGGRNIRKEFVMNPAGKSYVCILHEFVQHAERVQPKYVFKELENASTPYSATVMINDFEYGTGYGSSKKQAKSDAARATLEFFIPEIKDVTEGGGKKVDPTLQELSFFDDIRIEDSRVSDLCAKAGQHSPYQILVECLRRNFGMGNTDIITHTNLVKHQKMEYTMKVSKHTAMVICPNKREGKQRAAQAILQLLHPYTQSWGSLLRLYGRGSCKTPKEKKEEEQKITELQSTACANRPNYAILNKLKEEMTKLSDNKDKPKHIPKFTPDGDASSSTSNLKYVDL